MPVLVSRKAPRSPAFDRRAIQRLAETMLAELEVTDFELSVLLTDDTFIHELNREHRSKDKPTDVLSFPLLEPTDARLKTANPGAIGDVVISLDTALRQGKQRRHSLHAEVRFLLAHGILHLMGYDHETDAEEAEMDALTRRLVAACERSVGGELQRPLTKSGSSAKKRPATKKTSSRAPSSRAVRSKR